MIYVTVWAKTWHVCIFVLTSLSIFGQTGMYNANKPYAVVHFSAPGVVIKVGFFVDLKELVALNFLPDKKAREMIQDIKAIERIRNNIHNDLLLLLEEKGFCSLVSLLECHSRYIAIQEWFEIYECNKNWSLALHKVRKQDENCVLVSID